MLSTTGIEDWMLEPGASRSTFADIFENDERASALVVDPTATAIEMQAGWLIVDVDDSLPEAIAVNTPADLRFWIAGLWESVSQVPEVFGPPPKLMLTDATTVPPPKSMLANTWSRACT